jgi:hypothetical protein
MHAKTRRRNLRHSLPTRNTTASAATLHQKCVGSVRLCPTINDLNISELGNPATIISGLSARLVQWSTLAMCLSICPPLLPRWHGLSSRASIPSESSRLVGARLVLTLLIGSRQDGVLRAEQWLVSSVASPTAMAESIETVAEDKLRKRNTLERRNGARCGVQGMMACKCRDLKQLNCLGCHRLTTSIPSRIPRLSLVWNPLLRGNGQRRASWIGRIGKPEEAFLGYTT